MVVLGKQMDRRDLTTQSSVMRESEQACGNEGIGLSPDPASATRNLSGLLPCV